MKLLAFDIPDETAQLADWLEGHLVGIDLQDLVANLLALHPAAESSTTTLNEVCGDQLQPTLQNGLSQLSREQLRQLLLNPHLLLDLQERVFIEGGEHWLNRPISDEHQALVKQSATQIHSQLMNTESVVSTDPGLAKPTVDPSTRSSTWGWLISVVSIAAVLVISVTLWRQMTPAPTGWGWDRPNALVVNLPAKEYLNHLADGANDWYKKRPDTKEALITRLEQFRHGCETLINAPHPQLSTDDREWLVERCQAWAGKLGEQVAALEAGEDLATVQKASDAIIDKLMNAMRDRAKQTETVTS